ncbi:NAD-dependent epimerase/dehydratase family protein [Sphingobacterium corticibacter]|uniref:Epimerase n=1 Tax=Sphingobacterium corticibacter TaxID=2171749 RepID=A0A2T8HKN1_9SPHI|nr:NAD-dependent epimerase/dehydratase family protein [Sphingobacterium corticibacter]PVH26016.1 epimerase [Sphingobacterium corticibacter]
MQIKILGASGFVGRHLGRYLSLHDADVYGISLRENDTWKSQLIDDGDVIINLVGKAHDHDRRATENDYFHTNLNLTQDIFRVFCSSNATLFIHISSLAAIEEFESEKALGEENDCRPVSWYGQSKREAEKWLLAQEVPEGKKLIILRPPMIHGPGDKGNLGLLYKFVSKGLPYPLSKFNNRRSFISITNLCYLIEQIIEKSDLLESGIYHVADDEPMATNEIIDIIKLVTEKSSIKMDIPKWLIKLVAKSGDYFSFVPLNTNRLKKMTSTLLVSNQKIKDALGIDKLPLTAREGMEKTIQSFVVNKR